MGTLARFNITGMSCAACSARVEKAVSAIAEVDSCSVNLLTNSMTVSGGNEEDIIAAVRAAGYGASVADGKSGTMDSDEGRRIIRRLVASVVLLVPLMYLSMGHMIGLPYGIFEGNYIAAALAQLLLSMACILINGRFFVNGASYRFTADLF